MYCVFVCMLANTTYVYHESRPTISETWTNREKVNRKSKKWVDIELVHVVSSQWNFYRLRCFLLQLKQSEQEDEFVPWYLTWSLLAGTFKSSTNILRSLSFSSISSSITCWCLTTWSKGKKEADSWTGSSNMHKVTHNTRFWKVKSHNFLVHTEKQNSLFFSHLTRLLSILNILAVKIGMKYNMECTHCKRYCHIPFLLASY